MRLKKILIVTLVAGLAVRHLLQSQKKTDRHGTGPYCAQQPTVPAATNPDPVTREGLQPPASESPTEQATEPFAESEWTVEQPPTRSFLAFVASWFSLKPNPAPLWVRLLTMGFPLLLLAPKVPAAMGLGVKHEFSRFCAGLALTYVALVAYYLFKIAVQAVVDRKVPQELGNGTLLMVFQAIIWGFIIFIAGPAVWWIGWEGKNVGAPFGAGALLAGFVFQFGPMRLLEYVEPTLLRHHRVEIMELLELTYASANSIATTRAGEASQVPASASGLIHAQTRNERIMALRKKYGLVDESAAP